MNSYQPFYKNEIRRYPFLLLLIPLAGGIFFQYSIAAAAGMAVWLLLFTATGIIAVVLHSTRTKSPSAILQHLRSASLALLLFFLGASLSYYQDIRRRPDWYGNMLGEAESIRLRVVDIPEPKAHTLMIPARVTAVYSRDKCAAASGMMRLYIYRRDSLPGYRPGDELIIPAGKVVPIRNSGNPFAFDYAAYAARNGLFHQAFTAADAISYYPGQAAGTHLLTGARIFMARSIRLNIADSTTAALVEATILNERAMLDDELWKAYSITGIVHIIAISGMHISLLFGILLFFLAWLKDKRLEWVKYFVALPLVWFYIALTGFPPSAVRAAVMFTLLAFGIKLNRETNSLNILLATAFVLLCCNPYWLYDTGFQLSFMAVLSILLFYQPVRSRFCFRNRLSRFLWQLCSVSLAAQILTFPLAIYYFHQFPLWVLIANIPATVFSLLLMTGAIALLVLGAFTTCSWLGHLLTWLTKGFHAIIICLAHYTPAYFRELFIDTPDYWLLMLLIILSALYLRNKQRSYFTAGIIVFVTLIADIALQYYTAAGQKRIVVYNAARRSLVDFFDGRTIERFAQGTPDEKTTRYILHPAQLGYRAKSIISVRTKPYWHLHGKTVYLLEDARHKQNGPLKADYLIVGNSNVFAPEAWLALDPEQIIIDSSLPRWKAASWKRIMLQKGIAVYSVNEDGAWIFPRG